MKIVEENCQYEHEITGERAALSFIDVSEEEFKRLFETIRREVYTFGLLGYHNITEKPRHGSWDRMHSFSNLRGKNIVKLDHYGGSNRVNVFIHGPKAKEIGAALRDLVPEESLENLALSQGENKMIAENNIFYRISQGESRDREILERYRTIINYFEENPKRATSSKNYEMLELLYHNDRVLEQDEILRETLRKRVLNSREVLMSFGFPTRKFSILPISEGGQK
ncbi:MAG: hypothetical protein AABY22_31305 [Nanoarchaeota archaeon]